MLLGLFCELEDQIFFVRRTNPRDIEVPFLFSVFCVCLYLFT